MPDHKPYPFDANADQDDQAKIDRFKVLARELLWDEDETSFDTKLMTVLRSDPAPKHVLKMRV